VRSLVVGFGSIGRRHVRNLRRLQPKGEIAVWRQTGRPVADAEAIGMVDRVFSSLDEALEWRPGLAIVCTPAPNHVTVGLPLARAGIPLLVEKPLADRQEPADALVACCAHGSVPLMVAYNLRFYAPLMALREAAQSGRVGRVLEVRAEVGRYLADWRGGADYRQGISGRAELGGGVLLELSHELDYVRWILGEPSSLVAEVGRLSDLEIDVEDTAEVLLRFPEGTLAHVHLDMLQRAPRRLCQVIGSEGTLRWDLADHSVQIYQASTGQWAILVPASERALEESYTAELRHFLECLESRARPRVDGEDGRRTLRLALAARESSAAGRRIAL
jgi:predicted dehydrogenase